jgi:hypothetical protein
VRALADVVHQRHAVAAGVGDADDVHEDDRPMRLGHLELVEGGLLEDGGEALVRSGHDLPPPVQAQDPRRAIEGAQHHDDAPVLADVGDRLRARADDVEVGDRVVVEHAQRADRPLRRDVDVTVAGERRGSDEEQRLARDPRALDVRDALVDLAHG